MEPISHLHRYRRRPTFTRVRTDSSTYLSTARLHLLRHLPDNHRLMYRTTRDGGLKSSDELPPGIPRVPFTEEELAQIKLRRRHTPDPEDVRYQLQDSKLVQMWNADYDREEQWKEYDEAKSAMELKKEVAGLPDSRFDADEVVRERRRRVVAVEDILATKKSVIDDRFVKEQEMEEGEIEEEVACIGELEGHDDKDEEEEMDIESLKTLRKTNDRLRAANDAMRVAIGGLADNVLPASPVSEKSDSSGNESDDSMKVEYEFELSDNEEYSERSKWADKQPRETFSFDDLEFMRRVMEEPDDKSEEKEESEPNEDLG